MKRNSNRGIILWFALLAAQPASATLLLANTDITSTANAIAIAQGMLIVTAIISLYYYLVPQEHNRTLFHLFNLAFTVVFYYIAVRFLLQNKPYYEGFEGLSDMKCIQKYFTPTDAWEWLKALTVLAFFLNIIYIFRHGKAFYLDTD
jgi:hypothetical protein